MNGSQRIAMSYRGSLAVLKISGVPPDDNGEYTLLADNAYGKVSKKLFLFIL